MFDQPVVFVDIETTGGSYKNSRVLEIAALRYENGKLTEQLSTLLNPGTCIPAFITHITGITQADVTDAPRFADIAAELRGILDGAIFIAHNVGFDYSFIKNEFALLGSTFNTKRLCTVRLSRYLYKAERGHSLEKLIARHLIPVENRHRALDDAKAIVTFCQVAFSDHGKERFLQAARHQLKNQHLPTNLNRDMLRTLEEGTGVYIFRDKADAVLYVGKSVSIRKRVLSHFQDLTEKERRLAEATHRIETIPTGTEFLALILEAFLVKKLRPLHNVKLRPVTSYVMALRRYNAEGYPIIAYQTGLPSEVEEISSVHGLYETKTKAKKWNELIMKTYELCPKLMGLEQGKGACFNYRLSKCKGACVGKESRAQYIKRFDIALAKKKIMAWPFEGAVALPIDEHGGRLTVDNWRITGIENMPLPYAREVSRKHFFDYDIYKLLHTQFKLQQPLTL